VPFGPLLAWKRGDLPGVAQRLYAAAGIALLVGLAVLYFSTGAPVLAAFGVALGIWLIAGSLTELVSRAGLGKVAPAVAWRRLTGLPRSVFGTTFAHFGLGVTVIGIVVSTAYSTELVTAMRPGETVESGGYALRFEGLTPGVGPNYTELRGLFHVTKGDRDVGDVVSSKRLYTARRMPTTEAGIMTRSASQLYVALGDEGDDGSIVVRVWWKPWITFIWLGGVVMALGGLTSLADRRLRIGAPAVRRRTPAGLTEPAE
jgi:cytochrome c-type biogenesis protein CcmF